MKTLPLRAARHAAQATLAVLLLAFGFAAPAQAETRTVHARVVAVTPVYETHRESRPVQRCHDERRPVYGPAHDRTHGSGRATPSADTLAGALFGGAIGNQFGSGSGKDAMTVLGALIGADLARQNATPRVTHDRDHGHRREIIGYETVHRCDTVYETHPVRRVNGYSVTYRWKGLTGQTVTHQRYAPGERIEVRVSLR